MIAPNGRSSIRPASRLLALAAGLICASPALIGSCKSKDQATQGGSGQGASGAPASSGEAWKAASPLPEHITKAVDAPDRVEADRSQDVNRRPGMFLAFAGIMPGMKVGDVASSEGYTAELLLRAVGPTGTVLAYNPPPALEGATGKAWEARLARLKAPNLQWVKDSEMVQPFPADNSLDVVTIVLSYHDLYWIGVDRAKLSKSLLDALKPDGRLIIVDSAAAAGAGSSGVQSLHRIEESALVKDLEAGGFKLVSHGDFMRNPQDPRTASAVAGTPADRVKVDRFVLKFARAAAR
jgi:predicted methyltransferase